MINFPLKCCLAALALCLGLRAEETESKAGRYTAKVKIYSGADDKGELIFAPVMGLRTGKEGMQKTAREIQYLEKRPDGKMAVKNAEEGKFLLLTLDDTGAGEPGKVSLKYEFKIKSMDGRGQNPGIPPALGAPNMRETSVSGNVSAELDKEISFSTEGASSQTFFFVIKITRGSDQMRLKNNKNEEKQR
jgi:hypothetical protein